MEFTVERIQNPEELGKLEGDWGRLLAHSPTRTVELSHAWQTTFWKHFGASELFVLIAKASDTIVAIAPLKLVSTTKYGIRTRCLRFLAGEESNYQDFIVDPHTLDALRCIADYLAGCRNLWDVLDLSHIPETSPTIPILAERLGTTTIQRTAGVERCIFLTIDRSWEEYAKDSKKVRSDIAYRMRRLNKMGMVDYFRCSDKEQLLFYLEAFFELHRKRWDQDGRPSQFNDERFRQFYREVSPKLLASDQLDFVVLSVEDQPVAFSYIFRMGDTRLGQLMAYDPEYSAGAPARVLMELVVRESFNDSTRMIDFGHYYSYKEEWADRLKNRLNIEIYPQRPRPLLVYTLSSIVDALRERSKRIPPLRRTVRFVRQKLQTLRSKQHGFKRQAP